MSRLPLGPLYLATSNKGKMRELEQMVLQFFPQFKEIKGRPARFAPETENSFVGNALIKAHALLEEIKKENPQMRDFAVLADDSGLAVDALMGAPGVHSARFAGENASSEQNIEKLLSEMARLKIEPLKRSARYHCALVLILCHQGVATEFTSEGTCEGMIAEFKMGQSGFGYDPIFYVPVKNKHMAELSEDEKNAYSHRHHAFELLKKKFLS